MGSSHAQGALALLHAGCRESGRLCSDSICTFAGRCLTRAYPTGRDGTHYTFLAGMVMLTRISIEGQTGVVHYRAMGFMLVECGGLGLYTLAAVPDRDSLYKAHAFLSASSVVHSTRQATLKNTTPTTFSEPDSGSHGKRRHRYRHSDHRGCHRMALVVEWHHRFSLGTCTLAVNTVNVMGITRHIQCLLE